MRAVASIPSRGSGSNCTTVQLLSVTEP
jgi:hypothetical protein